MSSAPEFDYKWHFDNIRRIVSSFIRRGVNAEDLVHDCIEKVLKNRHLFDGNKSKYSTWVYTVATQAAIDHLSDVDKNNHLVYSGVEVYSQSEICTPENEYEARELAQRIKHVLECLPENQRKVVMLHEFEQMPLYMVADTLELKYGHVRNLYMFARKTINKAIEDYYVGT